MDLLGNVPDVAPRATRFDLEEFIVACREALREGDAVLAIRDVVAKAVSNPGAVQNALGATRAELVPLYSANDLTIMKAVWSPSMVLPPHNHQMWGIIGVYGGREVNHFFRSRDGSIEPTIEREFAAGEVGMFGTDAIHSVNNPLSHKYTAAIHVYGGDFMNEPRSVWLGEPLAEEPATGATMQRFFVELDVTE